MGSSYKSNGQPLEGFGQRGSGHFFFFFQLRLVFINKWLCFVMCFLLLLGLWFWKVGQLITQQQIAIYTSWPVMKTATEDMVFLTVMCRDNDPGHCSILGYVELYRSCRHLASVPSNLLWNETDGRTFFCFKWYDIFSILNHTSA